MILRQLIGIVGVGQATITKGTNLAVAALFSLRARVEWPCPLGLPVTWSACCAALPGVNCPELSVKKIVGRQLDPARGRDPLVRVVLRVLVAASIPGV